MILLGGVAAGGDDAGRVWSFDPVTQRWLDQGDDGPGAFWGIAAASTPEGTVIAIGGGGLMVTETGAGTITEVGLSPEVWLGSNGAWRQAPDLEGPVAAGCATFDAAAGRLVALLWNSTGLFDPAGGTWEWIEPPADEQG